MPNYAKLDIIFSLYVQVFLYLFRFAIGNKCTYVDLTLFHCLRATEAQFPEAWSKADFIPALKAFKERMAARPNIAAYLKSDRSRAFAGDSMM